MAVNEVGSEEYTIGRFSRPTISKADTIQRGVMDYTNPRLFNLYESGYSFLTVLAEPVWVAYFRGRGGNAGEMLDLFVWILENEFRGLSGIGDVTADNLEFTDGINTINTPGKINKESAVEISMTFTERSGLALTKFIDFYLTGLRDPRTQAKTYHGLIKAGLVKAGFENEVFMLLYIVTDNTYLALEKAFLLANAWPTKAELSILETEKGNIEKKEISIPWQCFLVDGEEVDSLAVAVLGALNEDVAVDSGNRPSVSDGGLTSASAKYYDLLGKTNVSKIAQTGSASNKSTNKEDRTRLDSTGFVEGSKMYSAVSQASQDYDGSDDTKGDWGYQ